MSFLAARRSRIAVRGAALGVVLFACFSASEASGCASCPVKQKAPTVSDAKLAISRLFAERARVVDPTVNVRCTRRSAKQFQCSWKARGSGNSERYSGSGIVRFTLSNSVAAEYRYSQAVRYRSCNPHRPDVCRTRTLRWRGERSL